MASVLPSPEEYAELAPSPGSPVWSAFNDARTLPTAGSATLLQVAHPTVGHGVHQYSSFTKDPWGRLLRTLDYVHGTIYGGPEMAGTIGARVRNMHKTIKGERSDGTRYSAMEPDAFAWVHATLAQSIFEGRRLFVRPMSDTEKEAFYREWLGVGRLVGVRERDLPDTVAGFEDYFDAVVHEKLEWTPAVPEVLDTIAGTTPPNVPGMRPGLWRVVNAPLAFQLRVATVGMLPANLRDRLGLSFGRRDRAVFDALAAASRASGPLVQGPLREFGLSYVGWRRQALARGDVAAAGSQPAAREAVA